ncbi:hypothetical protein M408DRAFT_26475 [Serendipita vermifera MAFF 305830]|uniref:Uncharacterized protein n=1 Tax=Serendipita vermifera MAFF 305830 TaxID=933852 RepID=A0A0C3AKI9_SERVB|nr:hypothetical protein M408DRAFT_26475 [Serendipita vermifera MAFF 305830]
MPDLYQKASLPFELWRRIFYAVIAESDGFAQTADLDISQLGPSPYQNFRPDSSKSRIACNLASVCRLWRILSEEVRYRHLHVTDIDSIEQIKALIVQPASNRIQTPSRLDARHRMRGSWTYSLTITSLEEVPSSLSRAHSFRLDRALLSLFRFLPNLRQLVTSGVFMPTVHLLSNLPTSLTCVSFDCGGPFCLSMLSKHIWKQITILELMPSPMFGYVVRFENLRWLSISPSTLLTVDWGSPTITFLRLLVWSQEEANHVDRVMASLGPSIRRLELHNNTNDMVTVDSSFLQWCPLLETLLVDIQRLTFRGASSPITSVSIKFLVLFIRDSNELMQKLLTNHLDAYSTQISDLVTCLPKLTEATLSFPIKMAQGIDYVIRLLEQEFESSINVPISIVFYQS